MERELQIRVLQRAVECGLVQPTDVEQVANRLKSATIQNVSEWGAELDAMLQDGLLKVEDLDRFYQEVLEESETTYPGLSPQAEVAVEAPRSKPDSEDVAHKNGDSRKETNWQSNWKHEFPVKNWARYEFRKLLGQGGMGVVYQAWDVKLNRIVALKFLRTNNEEMAQRFLVEARAQSRIEHENVCKVYEAGEVENTPYIAMQFINGKSLSAVRDELKLEQKIQVIRDTAQALHAAHRLGIIHRDIKPDNILVTQTEDGQWRPVVMDFGLAREVGNQGMTETGVIMGTPAYMSPEQARGEVHQLDRRTDVYSLGVVLYELLTGKLPFQGGVALKIVLKVLHEDPLSVSQQIPTIPADLNTITMKCLEKDPIHRYESSQALAQDLQHFLDGDPIAARATTWHGRLIKKARKHKPFVIFGSVMLALLLALGSASLWTWWQSARQAELARQMGEQAEKVEALMRFASLTAPHDIRSDRTLAQRELEVIRKQMAEAGSLGQGPGNYALGRGYLAFSQYDKAREHLERAYSTGFRTAGLELALGKVLGEFYRREVDDLPLLEDKDIREAQMKKLEIEYLLPIQRHLTAYLHTNSQASLQEVAYLEGTLAFYGKNYDLALQKAEAANGQASWFYEAKCLEGEIYLTWGKEKANAGVYEEALTFFQKAATAFQVASQKGPSYLQAPLGQARAWEQVIAFALSRGKPIQEPLEQALATCDRVLQLEPDNSQSYLMKASSYWRLGEFQAKKGDDPRPTLEQAITWAQQALSHNPQEVEAYKLQGTLYRIRGRYEFDHGQDPRPSLNLAAINLQKAIQLKPSRANAYNTLGLIYRTHGQYEWDHGQDPRPLFQQGIANYQKAVQLNPNYANAYTNLGNLYRVLGKYQSEHGIDPHPSFDLAATSFLKAIRLNPNYHYAHNNLGNLYWSRGQYELDQGQDPRPSLDLAAASLQKTIQLNPNYSEAYFNLGLVYRTQGQYQLEHGEDPHASLDQARGNFQKEIQDNPDKDSAYVNLGLIDRIRGQYELEHGQDPRPSFDKAIAHLQKALQLNPDDADNYRNLGYIFYLKLDYEILCGRNPGSLFENTLSNCQKSLQINPQEVTSTFYIGLLYCRSGQGQVNHGQNPSSNLEQSRIWLEKARLLKPEFEWVYRTQAEVELVAAQWATQCHTSPQAYLAVAEIVINKALEVKANHARAFQIAAQLALRKAEWATQNQQDPQDALADGLKAIEQSLAINPHSAETQAIKGTLLLFQAKITHNAATVRQARQAIEEALQVNQWLKSQYEPLLKESKQLVNL